MAGLENALSKEMKKVARGTICMMRGGARKRKIVRLCGIFWKGWTGWRGRRGRGRGRRGR